MFTCSGPDRCVVGLISTAGLNSHFIERPRSKALERTVLHDHHSSLLILQAFVSIIKKNIESFKFPLWWQPVEGQTRGRVAYDGEIINSRWTYNRHNLIHMQPDSFLLMEEPLRCVYVYIQVRASAMTSLVLIPPLTVWTRMIYFFPGISCLK